MQQILLIVLDGLADRPERKTPLKEAAKPTIDWLAKRGLVGLLDNGIRPGELEFSEAANYRLLGYRKFPQRGFTEALGAGLKPQEGDVCFRGNFSTVDPDWIVLDRRAGRDETGLNELCKLIDGRKINGCKVYARRAGGHRLGIMLRGKNLSAKITRTDPMETGKPVKQSKPKAGKLERSDSIRTAKILNKLTKLSYEKFSAHPVQEERKVQANILLARHPAELLKLKSFRKKYGIKAACISAVGDILGIGRSLGMEAIKVGRGHVTDRLEPKLKSIKVALEKKDFVFSYLKGSDEASHDKDFDLVKEYIERVDREIIAKIPKEGLTIALTCDHVTSVYSGEHEPGYCPIIIYNGKDRDPVSQFNELRAGDGQLGLLDSLHLMKKLQALS